MKKIIFILSGIILSCSFQAQEGEPDAVYNKIIEEYTLNQDRSFEYIHQKELELLTHFSFHRLFGETFVIYNPDYQDLNIDYAYTIMADGNKVVTPDNAFNEVLPRYANNAPAYNQLKEMVITHTGLEVGAMIHLGFNIHSSKEFYPVFMGENNILEAAPVKEKILRVKVPAGQEFNYKTFNMRTAPEITGDKLFDVYTWTFKNLPVRSHEPYQPDEASPMVMFSSGKDLQRVYDKFCSQEAFFMKSSPGMIEKVKIIKEQAESAIELMIKLQDMVVNEMATYNIPLEVIGFRVRPPMEVWQSNAGTALEKTLLLGALLREAGINAIPVASIPDKLYDKEFGNLMLFKNFLLQVNPKENKQYYISATKQANHNLYYDLQGQILLQLDPAIESLRTFTTNEEEYACELFCNFDMVDMNLLEGNMKLELSKTANPYLKLFNDKDYAKKLFSGGINSSAIKSFEFEQNNEIKTKISYQYLDDSWKPEENSGYYFIALPEVSSGLQDHYLSGLPEQRQTDLELENPVLLNYEYRYAVPEGFEMINPEKQIKSDNAAGKLRIMIEKSGKEIVISKRLQIERKVIPSNLYNEFRELMINWYHPDFRQIIIKKM
ncbi:MAG: DUF3857 domain-containing protein [Bacteroidales bacterium]|nr:DUF3857 domain-containing protein [Bacteroidales bacterium]MCF8343629.1 DUF3857 domain-containing protein [Bacteroidales bacterium]MCF8350115.1 DUF3857 domain-containing protein [Bacteroidales bacterium]MCF8376173.1 DUF3857 domain-containing protein [Bacteroidales bacterium]MCF8402263.1 DUF3857 domain-containing protein [Bacteroidales bacterium]